VQLFLELEPPETSDPDGLAVGHEGVKYIRDEIEKHLNSKRFQGDQKLSELHNALNELLARNAEFALLQQEEKANAEKHNSWRTAIIPLLNRIVELTQGRIAAASAPIRSVGKAGSRRRR
jgi:hypothetical protein